MPLITLEHRGPPPRLTGPIKTRADARKMYAEIVAELNACEDQSTLETYLFTIGEEVIQFENELDWFWNGDGFEFIGLDQEIKAAWQRVAIIY